MFVFICHKVFGRDDYYLCLAIMYGNYFFNHLYIMYGYTVYDRLCFENKEPCGRGKKKKKSKSKWKQPNLSKDQQNMNILWDIIFQFTESNASNDIRDIRYIVISSQVFLR